MSKHKTVSYPIVVPKSNNCFQNTEDAIVTCQYFDNSRGYPRCDIGFRGLIEVNDGVQKPQQCLELN